MDGGMTAPLVRGGHLRDATFASYEPEFDEVLGDAPRLVQVVEVDAHEGPVYAPAEDALYFTTLPRLQDAPAPGFPAVAIKRLALDGDAFPLDPGRLTTVVTQTNAANGQRNFPATTEAAAEPGPCVRVRTQPVVHVDRAQAEAGLAGEPAHQVQQRDGIDSAGKADRDPKSVLQEWAQGRGLPAPVYREKERRGPDHKPEFRVAVELPGFVATEGRGTSKRDAEQAAAAAMLSREGVVGTAVEDA